MDDEIAREHVERICRTALPKYGPAGTPRERRVVVTDLTPPHLVAAAKGDDRRAALSLVLELQNCRQPALHSHELRPFRLALLFQPVGIDQPGQIISGVVQDRAEQIVVRD